MLHPPPHTHTSTTNHMELQQQVLIDLLQSIGKSCVVVDNDTAGERGGDARAELSGNHYSIELKVAYIQQNTQAGGYAARAVVGFSFSSVVECVLNYVVECGVCLKL